MNRDLPTDEELRELEDGTLAGYMETHTRPPAFRGPDGHPYTVSVEMERVGALSDPWAGFLVFPRFALTGLGVVGHVETPFLWRERTPEDIRRRAGELTLGEIRGLLEEALADEGGEEAEGLPHAPEE